MSDDLNPKPQDERSTHPLDRKRGDSPIRPEKPKEEPQRVHPLLRRPANADSDPSQPQQRQAQVTFSYVRPRAARVVWALIAVNALIFALSLIAPETNDSLMVIAANQPQLVTAGGEYWRLLTSMFLHAGIAHVLMNMLALQSLGTVMEITFGHLRFALIYLLGGLAGSILSATLNDPNIYSVGASGAVFAVLGAEAAHLFTNWRVMGPVAQLRLRQLIMLALLNFSVGFLSDLTGGGIVRIDNWAHVGGFLGGAILAYLIGPVYHVSVSADQTAIQVSDTRPLRGQIATVIYYAAGLLALLLVAVVTG